MSDDQNLDSLAELERRADTAEREIARLQKALRSLETELSTAQNEALVAGKLKNQFLANISHEIRTPINGILGMTELLNDTRLTEKQRNFTSSIARSTESLLFVVNNMLDFSSLHHGKLALEENVFLLQKMIHDICSHYESKANAKGITLRFVAEDTLHQPVIGDEFRVRQIISNLVDNAVKFTDSGEIVITTTVDPQSSKHTVAVQDTGAGIAPELQAEIFKSFAQADGSSTRKHGGTGLGLAIANQLANLMQGEIAMQSSPGQGSCFAFSLKFKEASNSAINEIGKNLLQGTRVLIVDDTETNLEILSLQLQQWELQVECANSGEDALKMLDSAAAEEQPFQLAILDLNMPNMDGLELAQHIQSKDYAAHLRLMLLTSSVVDLSQSDLEQRGIAKSMLKPARQALLYETINSVIHSEKQSTRIPAPNRTTRILLTEDDPINQEVATTMLESMGYEVVVANNGAEAVDSILQNDNIDLVLMDCQMPVMDGFNATRTMREKNINTPIIALTANCMQSDKDLCIEAGMNDYLSKPIYPTDLSRVVEQWVTKTPNNLCNNNDYETIEPSQYSSENHMNIEIDETALNAIKSLQRPGQPDILARIVNMYIEKSPELISAIQEGVAANDCDKVKMAAHTLKSSSAYVGASGLAEVCGRVESKASTNQLGETSEDIKTLSSGFTSVVDQIKQYA